MNLARIVLWLLAALAALRPARAQNEELWISDLGGLDSVTVQVGEIVELRVNIRTNATQISGFQCFMEFDEDVAETVPYNESATGWFANANLFPGFAVFADDHDSRLTPLPGNQLDWCYQTGIDHPRPAYTANGVSCRFQLRFLQPLENYHITFDHDNNHFRNTLFWEGQSAVEHGFWRERSIVVNVVGIGFGPLPDVYLTTPAPCDSLDLYGYLGGLDGVEPQDFTFDWRPVGGPNDVCAVDTHRTADAFWLVFCADGEGRRRDFEICAGALGLRTCDTLAVLRGDPPIIDPEVGSGSPFLAWAEDDSAAVDLDDFVTDLDDPVEDLVWSVLPGGQTVEVTIDPATRRAVFRGPPDWNGADTLRLRAEDPGGMADTARAATWTWPVNDAPALEFGPRVELHPGLPLTIDLESVTVDIDNGWDELHWTLAGDTLQVAARLDLAARTLTLDVQPGTPLWTEVAFAGVVTDLEGLDDADTLQVLVSSYPPIWTDLDEILLPAGSTLSRPLFDYVADLDDPDSALELWAEGQQRVEVVVQPGTGLASFSSAAAWAGLERITLWARDADLNADSTVVPVYVLQGGNPLVVEVPDLVMLPGAVDSLELDLYARDLDTPLDQLSWEVLHAGLFNVAVRAGTRTAVVTAPLTPGTVDLATYRATDPEGHAGEDVGALAVIDPSGRPLVLPAGEVWMRTASVDTSVFLDALVYDYDDAPEEMSWSVSGATLVAAAVRPDRRLQLTSSWTPGSEALTLTVTDPDSRSASGALVVHVSEGRPPIVSEFAPRYVIAGGDDTLRTLSAYVYDPDEGDQLSWSFVDPAGSPVFAFALPGADAAVIRSDAAHVGVDLVGAVATDMELNSDMAWIEVHSLENVPPVIAAAVWPNPGLPEQLDVVVAADEPLRSLTGWQASDGAPLAFAEIVVAIPSPLEAPDLVGRAAFGPDRMWAAEAAAAARERVEGWLERTSSLRADFEQEVLDAQGAVREQASGRLAIARPGRFRWDYRVPAGQLLLSDGRSVWLYDEELAQVTVRAVGESISTTPAMLLSGNARVADGFEVAAGGRDAGLEWVRLRPKLEDTDFREVRLGFRGGELARMELEDRLGQLTRIAFSSIERNPGLPDDLFSFVPPPGVDVVGSAAGP